MLQPRLLHAQDPYFSQYFSVPMQLNPALTSSGVSDWRLMSTYRTQSIGGGAQPYSTFAASLEKNMLAQSGGENCLGIGAMMMSEVSNGGLLKYNYLNASIAYSNALDAAGKHLLGGGIALSVTNRLLDISKFLFQSQFGSGGYQAYDPANVEVPSEGSYLDVNAGLVYSIKNKRSGFYAGVGYFHATEPEHSIYNNTSYRLKPRFSVQMGYQKRINANGELQVSSVYETQNAINRARVGLLYKLGLGAVTNNFGLRSVNIGLWNRVDVALIPYIGLDGRNWLLGISYDVPIGTLAGSFGNIKIIEMSFGLLLGKKAENREVFVY